MALGRGEFNIPVLSSISLGERAGNFEISFRGWYEWRHRRGSSKVGSRVIAIVVIAAAFVGSPLPSAAISSAHFDKPALYRGVGTNHIAKVVAEPVICRQAVLSDRYEDREQGAQLASR